MSDKKYLPSEIRRPSRYRSERLQKHSHITSSVNIVDGNIDHFVEWYNTVGRYIKYNSKAKAWYIDGDFYTTGQNAAGNIGSPNVDGNSGWLIDDELSGTSTNPVQNRAIKEYIDNNFFNLRTGGSIFGDVQFEGNSSYFKRALYNQGLIVGMQGSKSYGIKFDHVAHGGEELYANGGFLYYDTSDLSKRILFESDLKAYATQKDLSLVSGRLYAIENYFSTEDDADTYINKWNEIVAFLNATEGTTLDNILSSKADKVEIPTRVSHLENDKGYITSAAIANKVDKEVGKGLSSNDYTDAEKSKLAAISVGAEANVQSDWLEFNSNRPEYIKNKTHGITSVQNAIITIRPDSTTEGTNLFEVYTDAPFMVNGIPYRTLDMLNKDFLVNDNIGPNVIFRVVEEGGSYFVKHIRGVAVVDYEYCNRVTITSLSEIYLPDTIVKASALESFLKLSGGTLSGSIDFGRHPLLSAGAEFLLSLGGATTYLKGSTGIWLETPELYTKRDNKSYRVLDLGMDIDAKTLGGLAETAFYRGKRASINISDLDTYVSRDVGAYSVAHSGHTSALLVLSKLTGGSNTSVEIYAPSYNPSLGLRLRFGIDSNKYSDWRDFAFLDDTIYAAYKLVNSGGDDIVTINSYNNVIIGASDTDSANYKLYVDGDIRAKNAIKIGEAIISWDNDRSALKIVGNVYATGQVAAGGFGNSEGGSGGGVILDYDSVVAALGFTPFDSAAFTKTSIKNALGIADWALAANKPSYNFSEIGSKPTTLSGYGITDALPKSGGTLTGQIFINTASGDRFFRSQSSSYDLGFGIGSGGVNRGIYDATNSEWWIMRDDNKHTIIAGTVNVYGLLSSDAGLKIGGQTIAKWADVANYITLPYLDKDTFLMPTNAFDYSSGRLEHSYAANALYAADKRFSVSGSGFSYFNAYQLFDGSYEGAYCARVEPGATATMTISNNGSSIIAGYPYGEIYLSFYNDKVPADVTVEVYCNYASQGIGWKTLTLKGKRGANNDVWYYNNSYYDVTQLRITITASASIAAALTEIDWHLSRAALSNLPIVTKFGIDQELWGRLICQGGITLNGTTITSWAGLKNHLNFAFSEIGSKPTTLEGYGITDAVYRSYNFDATSTKPWVLGYSHSSYGWKASGPAMLFGTGDYYARLNVAQEGTDNPTAYLSLVHAGVEYGWAKVLTEKNIRSHAIEIAPASEHRATTDNSAFATYAYGDNGWPESGPALAFPNGNYKGLLNISIGNGESAPTRLWISSVREGTQQPWIEVLTDKNQGVMQARGRLGATDANTLFSAGSYEFWGGAETANSPSGYATLLVSRGIANNLYFTSQLLTDAQGHLYSRMNEGGGTDNWKPWRTILDDNNISSYAISQSAADSRYLKLTGGTISGSIVVLGDITTQYELRGKPISNPINANVLSQWRFIASGDTTYLQAGTSSGDTSGNLVFSGYSGRPANNLLFNASTIEFSGSATVYGPLSVTGNVSSGAQIIINNDAYVDKFFHSKCAAYDIGFGVGAGNVNRGIFDFTNSQWWIVRGSGIDTTIYGDVNIDGLLTANRGIRVASGQALSFIDARGTEHSITYDSAANAFKVDGSMYALGQLAAGEKGEEHKKVFDISSSATSSEYVITHNFQTYEVSVAVYKVTPATGSTSEIWTQVIVDIEITSADSIKVSFYSKPSNTAYKVVIIA